MNEKVDIAVLNNIVWCGLVCETHGITAASGKHIWRTTSNAPIYYPDMITSSRLVTIEEVKDIISTNEVASVKDSFANLDMSPFGYELLFTADWIFHELIAKWESVQAEWRQVTTENDLAEWTSAHGTQNLIRYELLERKDVKIYMNKKKDNLAGFIANLGANAIGISNVFSSVNREDLWSDISKIISNDFPGVPMVGYERGADLTAALQSGWITIGPLRVWVKSNDGLK